MSVDGPIRVVIADDHQVVREGLQMILGEERSGVQVVGEAATGEEAVRLSEMLRPDVVLMDLLMPGIDGVEATRQIKLTSPHTQVIVLTSYAEDERIFPAIKAGALSYLLKDIGADDLVRAIKSARRHGAREHAGPHRGAAGRPVPRLEGRRSGDDNRGLLQPERGA